MWEKYPDFLFLIGSRNATWPTEFLAKNIEDESKEAAYMSLFYTWVFCVNNSNVPSFLLERRGK